MVYVSNLARALKSPYNYQSNTIKTQLKHYQQFDNKEFQRKTIRLQIFRENILASGMEVTDIDKALIITTKNSRR